MSNEQRGHIIKTAGEMFFRLGIRSVSIDDICHELGMSKKTFYVYFESKDELVAQMLHANVEYIAQKMEDLMALHDFRQLVAKFLKHQEAEKNDVRRLTAELFAMIHSDAIRHFEEIESSGRNMHQIGHTAMDVFVRGILSEEGLELYK